MSFAQGLSGGLLLLLAGYWGWLILGGIRAAVLGPRQVILLATIPGLFLIFAAAMLSHAPGPWVALVPLALALLLGSAVQPMRHALADLGGVTALVMLVLPHALRLVGLVPLLLALAEGGWSLALLSGLPDLFFALSLFWLIGKLRRGQLSRRHFSLWNLLGMITLVIAAASGSPLPVLLGPFLIFFQAFSLIWGKRPF